MKIRKDKLASLLASLDEEVIFQVEFVKRTTGEVRKMTCKLNKKGGFRFDPSAMDLLPVWDVEKEGYRMVSLDSLLSASIHNKTYSVRA